MQNTKGFIYKNLQVREEARERKGARERKRERELLERGKKEGRKEKERTRGKEEQEDGDASGTQVLIIDEADRILEQGFEDEMREILKLLPSNRQSMLFSATQTSKVEDLARLSLRGKPGQ